MPFLSVTLLPALICSFEQETIIGGATKANA